ncbi:MAG TPA: glycoside hydrolase family 31 protein [Bacteroidales bacterium]|nr:glycoside hydrolase family 31 protein [Bacteroidales bacterium]
MKNFFLHFLLILLLCSCTDVSWKQTGNGVTVKYPLSDDHEAGLISIEVVNERIMHVKAYPFHKREETESLCVVGDSLTTSFTVTEKSGSLLLETPGIKASVSLLTGRISFHDRNGRIILAEPEKDARSFNPVESEGTHGYSFSQVFGSDDDEALYGLGQHQSDEFNYKGLNETLYQYNTKVSVPFFVSTRNYGILWDNYSLTRFGDPRDYSQLSMFSLYDEDGNEGGLTATYYSDRGMKNVLLKRTESSIDYENLETVRNLPGRFPSQNSSATWTGHIKVRETGRYQFRLYYAGYVKLYLDDTLIVPERWRTSWNPNTKKFFLDLEEGERRSVRLEWIPDGGASYIGLKALSPLPSSERENISLFSEMGDCIDYYFIHGNSIDEVISGYRTLTGKAPLMPKWALGYWQSRERYKSQKELLDVVREYRIRNIPLDNIVLDWSYWPVDSWGSHEFDPKYFPAPERMVGEVHMLKARIMISVWPKFYINTEHFREFDSRGWMYKQAVRDSIRDWIGRGYVGSFYDAYSPGARELFWNQIHEHLYTKGFDAWWMDASEPDILSNASIQYRKKLMTPTELGPSEKYFNAYALMNAMTIYEGQRSADPDKRVFLLTRSGFAGLQRFSAATWSGDIAARWEDMKAQIPAGLNYSLSGIPYWTFDIGGFCVENRYRTAREGSEDIEEWRELNTRWFQFGAFCPLFRSHGQYPFREIYNIAPVGHPAYNSMVWYDRFRYRLMPYIYSVAAATSFTDYTIMRAMAMDFGSDRNVFNTGDQYMFGPSLLVAPVYEYKARKREVYLPSSFGWYEMYTGEYHEGGHAIEAEAPYERIPLFVRAGSIIPVGPAMNYTDEVPANPITLWVYKGHDCVFTLYEDEGVNYNYEMGKFSSIRIRYDEETETLTIGKRNGEFGGMLKSRIFNIIWVGKERPAGFDTALRAGHVVRYTGDEVVVKDNQ